MTAAVERGQGWTHKGQKIYGATLAHRVNRLYRRLDEPGRKTVRMLQDALASKCRRLQERGSMVRIWDDDPHVEVAPTLKERFSAYIDARTAKGIETYGGPLTTNNGRDVQRDMVEELLDFAQYQQQRIMELESANARLMQSVRNIEATPHGQDCDVVSSYHGPQDKTVCDCHVRDAERAIAEAGGEPSTWRRNR